MKPGGIKDRLAKLRIRSRLLVVIMIAVLLTLATGGVFILSWDRAKLEEIHTVHLQNLADAYSQPFAKIIILQSTEDASDVVRGLSSFSDLTRVYLFDKDNKPVFRYVRGEEAQPPLAPASTERYITHMEDKLVLYLPMSFNDVAYGTAMMEMSTVSLEDALQGHLRGLLAFAPVLLLIAVLLAFFLQGVFTTPLLQLRDQLRTLTVDRDFTRALETNEGSEIGELYQGINAMLVEIRNSHQALTEANASLEAKVHARTRELEESRDQLVESEKMAALGGLVAGVAHEVNTPVGIGVTAATHLQEEVARLRRIYQARKMSVDDFSQFLLVAEESSDIILRNMNRAAELIRSFKEVASDQSHEELREFDLGSYLQEINLSLSPQYKKTPHSLLIDAPERLMMRSYPGAIAQIVTNLVRNSLDHAFGDEMQGEMRLQVQPDGSRVKLTYMDNGKGVDKKIRDTLFEPFVTTRRSKGNTGLGMHIVYNLVSRTLNGQIHFDKDAESGMRIVITIPQQLA